MPTPKKQKTLGPTKLTIKPKAEDEEEAPVEEQLILRMPPGVDCDRLREWVKKREVPDEVSLRFHDTRRATFRIQDQYYDAKLVDLPCIIESHKTPNDQQFYKIADISQMILVEEPPTDAPPTYEQMKEKVAKPLTHEEYTFPHGITPPLWNVRKRRFRKRLNKRTIEDVEREVLRLLEADGEADEVVFHVDDGQGDFDDMGLEEEVEGEMEDAAEVGDEMDLDVDPFEAALDEVAADGEGEEEEEESGDDDDDDDDESGDDNDIEPLETGENESQSLNRELIQHQIAQMAQEVQDLSQKRDEAMVNLGVQVNPIMKRRFEDHVTRFTAELEAKQAALTELQQLLA
ncbi:hypothetical protein HDU85_003820 [Gaertneriomyces sp. JEL0708]|nr:hypothetical protein HDU85_003820 [Gaertneriomyces sp. JEL0708]